MNIAARLEGLAEPGGICVSAVVRDQVRQKLDLGYDDLGEQELKSITEPLRAYNIALDAGEPLAAESLPGMDGLAVPGFSGRPAIAVLPFDNLSGDPDQECFADGIAEDLITLLSTRREFPAIARHSPFAYRGKAMDVGQVSRELGVRYVVEGSVQRLGDRVRITAQLIDATTGVHIWADRYDRELEDIFAIQDEITTAIAAALGRKLARTEAEQAARQQSTNPTAYDLLMRGRWCGEQVFLRRSGARLAEARSLFEQAIEVDPGSAAAFAALAMTHALAWYSPAESDVQSQRELERAARKSVSLDPELPMAHLALPAARELRGELDEALAAARRAIELGPSFVNAYRKIGFLLVHAGKPEEAIAALEKGGRLSPRFAAQRYEQAVECAKRCIQRGVRGYCGWLELAASQAQPGRLDEAQAALREADSRTESRLTATEFRRILCFMDADALDRFLEGLRKAGLPE